MTWLAKLTYSIGTAMVVIRSRGILGCGVGLGFRSCVGCSSVKRGSGVLPVHRGHSTLTLMPALLEIPWPCAAHVKAAIATRHGVLPARRAKGCCGASKLSLTEAAPAGLPYS